MNNNTPTPPIKPFVWKKNEDGAHVAQTWIGDLIVYDSGCYGWLAELPSFVGAWHDGSDDDEGFPSAEEAMANAEAQMRKNLLPFLDIPVGK